MPMKKIPALALLAACLCLTGCPNKDKTKPGPEPLPDDVVEVRLPHNMNDKAQDYNVQFHFDDAYFQADARQFNKDLALLSLGNTFTTASSIFVGQFYDRLGFENVIYGNYSITPTEDTIGYSFAHKKIGDSDVIAVCVRGFNYGKEWSNNFLMGSEGNHEGFDTAANQIYNHLKNEVEVHDYQNLKLWITGYSRGGGVSNVLSQKILSSTEFTVEQENMFVYTFEAPRGLTQANAMPYANVFNIINNADLVTYVAPEQYGLYRCGVDQQIYTASSNISRLLYEFDKDIVIPEYTPVNNCANEQEYISYLINEITKELDTSDPTNASMTAHTREDYVNNYQSGLRYMMGLFFSLNSSTTNKIMDRLSQMDAYQMGLLLGDDGFYNFLKPMLDEDDVSYNDAELKTNCAVITKLLRNNILLLTSLLGSSGGMDNIKRILYMHAPEVEYVLLKDLKIY